MGVYDGRKFKRNATKAKKSFHISKKQMCEQTAEWMKRGKHDEQRLKNRSMVKTSVPEKEERRVKVEPY